VRARSAAALLAATALAAGACSSAPKTPVAHYVHVTLLPARPLSAAQLATASSVLGKRLAALHFFGAAVTVSGANLLVTVEDHDAAALPAVAGEVGALRIRPVLAEASAAVGGATGSGAGGGAATPTPTASGGPFVPLSGVAAPGTASPVLAVVRGAYARWSCATDMDPTNGGDAPSDYTVGCTSDGRTKYLLGPAVLSGADIQTARAAMDTQTQKWLIVLTFTPQGSAGWQQLTARAASLPRPPGCAPPRGCDGIAMVLDGKVEEAPFVDPSVAGKGIAGGSAQITGAFTAVEAEALANILDYGALPAPFTVGSAATGTASPG
jgi:preprotein translocase subunit SecD